MNAATLRPLALLLLLALLFATPAAARVELRFMETRTLPALGLQLRILSNSREVPLPAIHAHAYAMTVGTVSTDVELYTPRELWIAEQQGAEWIDPFSNTLVIAAMRTPLPGPFIRQHVMQGEYEAARTRTKPPATWALPELAQWASDFTTVPGARALSQSPTPPRVADLVQFSFPAPATNILAYAFRLQPAPPGRPPVPADWFFVCFRLGPQTHLLTAQQTIRTRFFQYVAPVTPATATAKSATTADNDALAEKSPEFLASRQQVAQSVANLKDWWYLESENYIALSNLKGTERSALRDLLANVEVLRRAFTQWIPPRTPITAVSVIRIPATEEEYTHYVGAPMAWSGGLWMPARKELVIRPLKSRGTREQREQMLGTAYHEAFHQYCYYALNRLETAPWFAEGQAALFETIDLRPRGLQIREDPIKLAILNPLLDNPQYTIAKLLPLDFPAFYAGDSDITRANHYVLAWGLNYYLRLGVDARSPYAGLLERYVERLWQTGDSAKATTQTFADVDLDQLQRDFRTFWLSTGRRNAAQRNRTEFPPR